MKISEKIKNKCLWKYEELMSTIEAVNEYKKSAYVKGRRTNRRIES